MYRLCKENAKIENYSIHRLHKNFRDRFEKKVLAPWLRPAKLAQDNSSSESATLHALSWCEKKFGKFLFSFTFTANHSF